MAENSGENQVNPLSISVGVTGIEPLSLYMQMIINWENIQLALFSWIRLFITQVKVGEALNVNNSFCQPEGQAKAKARSGWHYIHTEE